MHAFTVGFFFVFIYDNDLFKCNCPSCVILKIIESFKTDHDTYSYVSFFCLLLNSCVNAYCVPLKNSR